MVERAGVLAMQGDVAEHVTAVSEACDPGVDVRRVRTPAAIEQLDLLVLPGGESTTISRLLEEYDVGSAIRAHVHAGKPLVATCAGLILAASAVADDRIETLDLLDISVERNAYGRQRASFEAPLTVDGLDSPFPGVFIRAPRIASVGDAEVLATIRGEPVAVREGPVIGASFHPELTDDSRFYQLALSNAHAEQ